MKTRSVDVLQFLGIITAATCLALMGSVARGDLADGLVAYWPLDDNFEDAVGEFDGEEVGSLPIDFDAGQFGNGIVLNGDDQYVEIVGGPDDGLDFFDSEMSISAWFRVDAFDTSWQALIAKGEQDGWRLHRRGDESGLAFTAGEPDTNTTGIPVDDGAIHHVVAVSAADPDLQTVNGLKRIYIDGVLGDESIRDEIGIPNTNNRVRIGDNPSTSAREWEGLIDDVALWDRALTDDEVAQIWNNGEGASIGSLTGGGALPPFVISQGIDTHIAEAGQQGPDGTHGDLEEFEFDGEDGGGENHALLWFDIPPENLAQYGGSASLRLHVTNEGTSGDLYRMSEDWLSGPDGGDFVTWNNIPGGPGVVAGVNTVDETNASTGPGTAGTTIDIDVSADVQAWADGEPNFGWGFLPTGTNGYGIASFENTQNPIPQLTLSQVSAAILQAGDADQDFDFDQLDLVKVQIGGKYLTGQAATWGEGDWNGAPGGSQGNPPPGDGFFNQVDIIAALNAGTYLTGPYYPGISPGGQQDDGQTSVGYNAITGEVWVDAPAGQELTSINIDSAGSIFTGDAAQNLGGSFDNDADNNIFKATFGSSFGSLSFGTAAQPGLSEEFVANDLTVVGSLAGGGDLGPVDLIYIPEPSTCVLLGLGVVAMLLARRRR